MEEERKIRDFSKQTDIIQTVLVFLIALLVPTFLGNLISNVFGKTSVIASNSQLIIGSIVNATLIISALNLKGKAKLLGVITMPSISTLLGGYVFKSASPFMVFMIPAIWIGNFALIYAYKFLKVNKISKYILASVLGIILKVSIIFGLFAILNAFNIFPQKMIPNLQKAMGTTQLITASIGATIAFIIYILESKKEKIAK